MKSRLTFAVAVVWGLVCAGAALSLACVAIQYPVITDNAGEGSFTVNTNGKAHLQGESSAMTAINGGKVYTVLNFVDQGPTGSQKLSAYELELAPGGADFHDDTYCSPDWTGCAFFTRDYTPPSAGCSFADPGIRMNLNCLDISIIGLCFDSRSAVCGRGSIRSDGLKVSDIANLIEMGIDEGSWLTYNLNAANTRIQLLSPQGSMTSLRIVGNQQVRYDLVHGRAIVDLSSPNWAATLRKVATLSDNGFRTGTVQITFGNVTRQFNYGALEGDTYRTLLMKHGM